MQNSTLNHCHFSSPNTGFTFSQIFNSRLINDTVDVVNCFFHNVNKDFKSETEQWQSIMLLNDMVGIGINSKPTTDFQIGDAINNRKFRYVDGSQGAGKVLASDDDGNATWTTLSTSFLHNDTTVYFTPESADTVAPGDTILLNDSVSVIPYHYNIIDSTGSLSNLKVVLPSNPVEGEWVEIKLEQSGVLVRYLNGMVANNISTFITSLNPYIKLVFRAGRNTWY